jgi:hypothetical protein
MPADGAEVVVRPPPGAIDHFTSPDRKPSTNPDEGPRIQVNAQIAVAR